MPKDLSVVLLLDYYGGLLPDKQRRLVEYYYCDDLSLAEISDNEKITRQGARDAIVRAVAKLKQLEQTVGFINKSNAVRVLIDKYAVTRSDDDFDKLCEAVNNL